MVLLKEATITPWGKAQSQDSLGRGLQWVTTASHGGLMKRISL